MGLKVSFDQVKKDMTLAQKSKIFPNFNNNDEQFIKVLEDNVCNDSVSVNYDTNYAILAAETAKLKEIIAIAGSIVDEDNIIINKKNITAAANDLVDLIFEEKLESDLQEFKFTVEPCVKAGESLKEQCFQVVLDIDFVTIVTDFEDKTDDELAELFATLEAGNSRPKTKHYKNKKKRKGLVPNTLTVTSDVFSLARKFQVRAQLVENAITDGELGEDSVSGVRINNVKFTVSAVPCPKKPTEVPPTGDGEKPPTGNGDESPSEPIGLERIEEIGPKLASSLNEAGIKTLEDLAVAGDLKVKNISAARMNQFATMAGLMVKFDNIDGNMAELLVRGFDLKSTGDFEQLASTLSLSKLKEAAERVKLPRDFDVNRLAEFITNIG